MRSEIVELFFNNEMREKYQYIKPFKNCKKCEQGLNLESDTICECSIETILKLIAEIPERYDVDIQLTKSLQKQADEYKKFLVLSGEDKYMRLLAYYIAKKCIKEGLIVRQVSTISASRYDQKLVDDITSMNKADLIIFEDIFKKQAAAEYQYEIKKRIGKNKGIIFLGKTELVVMDDDFLEIEVDSSDVKVI